MHTDKLSAITRSVLNSAALGEYISCAQDLSAFYEEITAGTEYTGMNEAVIKGGIALSSVGAADCVNDYLRTVFFIKGVYTALTRLADVHPDRAINVLYAGSGPFATLLLPLLPLFNSRTINAIVLDINQQSLDCVKNILDAAGLQDYDLALECADATNYRIPADFAVDLCISETMHYGLTSEPQVSIIKNLAPQLPVHALLIPQQITIDLAFSFFAKEPYLRESSKAELSAEAAHYPLRVHVDRLFTVDKEHLPDGGEDMKFESKPYAIPKDYSGCPDICIFTEVHIIDGISLKTAESYITNPYCIASLMNFDGKDSVTVTYDFSEIPLWYCNA